MAGQLNWRGGQYRRDFEAAEGRKVKAAAAYLAAQVKADISQPGTLRYHPMGANGRPRKSQRTVYHFTHSRPGNPPFKQFGNLRKSIATDVRGLVGRVGSNIKRPKYPLYLELGTKKMSARSYLRAGLINHQSSLRRILGAGRPGPVAAVRSNQYRPGHFGRGAAAAGWA